MNKSILTLAASALISASFLTSCDSASQHVANAEKDVKSANVNLDKANKEYDAEVLQFKKEAEDKIAANEKSIAEFKARKEAEKKDAKVDYDKKLRALEQKNSDMKKQLEDYKFESKEKWETFKAEFSNGLSEVGKAFNDLIGKKSH